MSRAFVKEIDDLPEPPLQERPISDAPNLVTRRGADLILKTIDDLQRGLESLGGNAAERARRDLRYWQVRRATMQIVDRAPDATAVGFGAEVTIRRGKKKQVLRIVGEDEADPAQGYLAYSAPLARALEEAEAGETVEFEAGGRIDPIEILSIRSIASV